jgi:hypothetical protein
MPIEPNFQRHKEQDNESGRNVNLFEDDEEEAQPKRKPTENFNKIVLGCVAVGILILAVVLIYAYFSDMFSDSSEEENTEPPPVNSEVGARLDQTAPWLASPSPNTEGGFGETLPETNVEADRPNDLVIPGIVDISEDTVKQNTTPVTSDNFVKDLNSLPVDEFYEIEEIYTTIDFISYEKKRAVTDDGVELYWLEATYKGKKAKIQVPFKVFKELDKVGSTVVDVEVVRVRTGTPGVIQEIVTSFSVNPDYKKILEQSRR